MSDFLRHDGKVKIGDLFMEIAEFAALVPNFPSMPEGVVTQRYENGRVTLDRIKGGQLTTLGAWVEADALDEAALSVALDAHRFVPD